MSANPFPTITTFVAPKKNPAMKSLIALLLIGTARLTASDDLRLLDAISAVESGNNDDAVSSSGARGRYQFMEGTWRLHSKWPFRDAHNPTKAQVVALMHLRWLRDQLGRDPEIGVGNVTAHHLASAWLRGVNYRKNAEHEHRWLERLEYCARVTRLMEATR